MTQPSVVATARAKTIITPKAALVSTLRIWMMYRDNALWSFVSGVEADDPLEELKIEDAALRGNMAAANDARQRALDIAAMMAEEQGGKAATILREAIDELLAAESPRFLLAVPHIAGTF